jgi:hypothetical protein
LQAIKLKFLALEQQKRKKDLKSVFNFPGHVFTSQARRRTELPFFVWNFNFELHERLLNEFKYCKNFEIAAFKEFSIVGSGQSKITRYIIFSLK